MAHKAEHSEIIELNDGALGVKFLCCGDPKSVQSHTFMVREDHTDADYEKWLADRYAEVEKAHALRGKAKQFMEKFKR